MPDWRRLVGRRIRALNVPSARRDEIERELAGFLEDHYETDLRQRREPRAAMRDAIARVGGWPELTHALGREEKEMSRLRTLWLPALVVALSALLLSRLPHARWGGLSMVRMQGHLIVLVWTWLVMLPFLGALGAAWSRREGGGRSEQLFVATAPVFALAVVFGVAMVLIGRPASQFPERGPIPGRLVVFLNFVLIPALPVLLGCVPTLLGSASDRPGVTTGD